MRVPTSVDIVGEKEVNGGSDGEGEELSEEMGALGCFAAVVYSFEEEECSSLHGGRSDNLLIGWFCWFSLQPERNGMETYLVDKKSAIGPIYAKHFG